MTENRDGQSPASACERGLCSSGAGTYPEDWKHIATRVKDDAGWRCVRCGHPHERPGSPVPCDEGCDPAYHSGGLNDGKQRILTVHHLDGQKDNCAWWNCAALCQVCHLHIQGKVKMGQVWPFEHSEWFKPYVAGFYAYHHGLPDEREAVLPMIDELIALGQGRTTVDALRRAAA